jgi:hypothetical protein
MDSEQRLSQQIEAIRQAGEENKNVDVSALMLAALERHEQNLVPAKSKRIAYLVSLAFPPFGLLYALKYYFGEEDDAKHVALTCVLLTIFAIVIFFATVKLLFNTSGVSVQQIEQIKPADIYQLTQ